MREHAHAGMSLYGPTGSRKYLNAAERRRFIKAARRAPLDVQLFCLVLSLTGGRLGNPQAAPFGECAERIRLLGSCRGQCAELGSLSCSTQLV